MKIIMMTRFIKRHLVTQHSGQQAEDALGELIRNRMRMTIRRRVARSAVMFTQ